MENREKVDEVDSLKVSVSGATLYKAVSNHLRNSPEFQKAIQDKVSSCLSSQSIQASLEKRIQNSINNNWDMQKEIKKAIEKEVKEQLKELFSTSKIADSIRKAIKDIL